MIFKYTNWEDEYNSLQIEQSGNGSSSLGWFPQYDVSLMEEANTIYLGAVELHSFHQRYSHVSPSVK